MEYRDYHPKRDTQSLIARVGEDKHSRKKLGRVMERFPHEWLPIEQAAYILRAFSGLQLFPDANHRTGLAISRVHLRQLGYGFSMAGEPLKNFIDSIRNPRSPTCARCNAGALLNRDAPFLHIASVMETHTRRYRLHERMRVMVSQAVGFGRMPESVIFESYEDPDEEAARKATLGQPL